MNLKEMLVLLGMVGVKLIIFVVYLFLVILMVFFKIDVFLLMKIREWYFFLGILIRFENFLVYKVVCFSCFELCL